MSPAVVSSRTLAVGPGYQWLLYVGGALGGEDGVEYARLSLDDGGIVHREGRRWYCTDFKGNKLWLDPARIEPLRGTNPDDFPVWPDQAEIALPAELAHNADTGDLLQAIADEYGLVGPDAWKMASSVLGRTHSEQANRLARRIVHEAQIIREADLATIRPLTIAQILDQPRPPRMPLFGRLLAEGHNATIVARWKVGKSTFVDNAAVAACTGGMFLGRFEVPAPRRVVLFNYELHDDDMADRLAAMAMPREAQEQIVVVNLRGRRLPILSKAGRDTCVRILADAGADVWIVDPFGAAYAAAGGEDENNNAEVRRFLIALDEIKRLADCASLLMPVHTGRRVDADGDEQGRGATVLEDWPDVRIVLTRGKDDQYDQRFLRTEGRAWELKESRLAFEERTRRLMLPTADMGLSRTKAKYQQHAEAVVEAVRAEPGATVTRVRELLRELEITNTDHQRKAIDAAKDARTVHTHPGKGNNAIHHYEGPPHGESEPCRGGFTP